MGRIYQLDLNNSPYIQTARNTLGFIAIKGEISIFIIFEYKLFLLYQNSFPESELAPKNKLPGTHALKKIGRLKLERNAYVSGQPCQDPLLIFSSLEL